MFTLAVLEKDKRVTSVTRLPGARFAPSVAGFTTPQVKPCRVMKCIRTEDFKVTRSFGTGCGVSKAKCSCVFVSHERATRDVLSRVAEEFSPSEPLGDNKESPVNPTGDKEAHMTNPVTEAVTDPFELLEESIEKLQSRAKGLGIEIAEKGANKASIIEALVEASMTEAKAQQEVQPGVLLALHTRHENAKELIRLANQRIQVNQYLNPPRLFSLLLRNKEGELYTRTVPGVRVSNERLPQILQLVVLPPDGAQNEEFDGFKKNPEAYEQPVLVRVARRNKDGSVRSYVMLYLQRKSTGASEQVF